jgi:hypothetical protein
MKKFLFPPPQGYLSVLMQQSAKLAMLWLLLLGNNFTPAAHAACACDSPLATSQTVRYPLPSDAISPTSVAVGDFNSDDKNDLLIANYGSSNVSVLLGDGSGGFITLASSISVGNYPTTIVARDFNGDGHLDFATAGSGIDVGVSIRYGNGSGGVSFSVNLPILLIHDDPNSTRLSSNHMAVLDFDHSSNPDLAVATNGGLIALFRNIGNTFMQIPSASLGAANTPQSVSAADLNGDGWDDLAAVRSGAYPGANVFVLLNNHLDGWNVTSFSAGELNFMTSAVADYDKDGDVDLLVGSNNSNFNMATVSLYTNNASGVMTFSSYSIFSYLARLTAADINMDGFGDFIGTNYFGGARVFPGNRQASLGSLLFSADGSQYPNETAVADFNSDGKPDMAVPGGVNREVSVILNTNNLNAIRKTYYNGDGRTDFAIWRPADGTWHIKHSYFVTSIIQQFGATGDVPVTGDYDGDKKSDLAVFRPSTNSWYILRSSNNSFFGVQFGSSGDKLVPGDYDGDCKTDIAVWRPSNGYWYILRSSDSGYSSYQWGQSGDIPVIGDYDGDCKTDVAVWRPSIGGWYIVQSSTGNFIYQQWGQSAYKPMPADYDGDGKTDIAIWHPPSSTWWIVQSTGGSFIHQFGSSGDIPQPGDYDGDGHTDLGLYTPSVGTWFILRSSNFQAIIQQWGVSSDVPASAPYQIQ